MLHLEALADAPSLTPKQLAAKHGDEAARWALMQLDLRKRATKKFGDRASEMLFEREALEQATSLSVARYHASQFPMGSEVVDLTAGLGGDAIALAERGSVVAYEKDPARAELLEFNLLGSQASRLQSLGDAEQHSIEVRIVGAPSSLSPHTTPNYVWADPDRRSDTGRRLTKPEDYTPNPAELAEKFKDCKLAGIKLSPLLPDDYLESLGGSLEFISHQGECLEAIIWLGTENTKPKRQAVILHSNQPPSRIVASNQPLVQTSAPKRYIHDCDPAVVRAHCLAAFGFSQIGDSPGYLTSDDPTPNSAYRTYEVLASPTKNKLKAELQRLDAKAFELKQRGAGLDPTVELKKLKSQGDKPVSLICFREGNSIRYVVTHQLG